jgi:hypothetical protein
VRALWAEASERDVGYVTFEHLRRDGEPFSQRFTTTLSDDQDTITGRWEIGEDGTNYTTAFDLITRRVETNVGE